MDCNFINGNFKQQKFWFVFHVLSSTSTALCFEVFEVFQLTTF